MIFVLLSLTLYASEPKLPDGISCEVIRQAVAEHGRFKSIRWAGSRDTPGRRSPKRGSACVDMTLKNWPRSGYLQSLFSLPDANP